jgi:DNA-binding LacI/PurR family transcriptional regulator
MTKQRTTIADVAAAAGVSKGLVSFALNGRAGVASDTRQRILATARDLGWTPNLRARSLSTDRAFALGLVIARAPQVIADDPFFPAFISGIESVLASRGQSLVLGMVGSPDEEREAYRRLAADGRVDGVVLTDLRSADPRLALAAELGLPAVTLGRPDVPTAFPAIVLDDARGVRDVVAHLAGIGHRRIAHVAGPSHMLHGIRRRVSFEEAMTEYGLDTDLIVETDFSAKDGARATAELLAAASPGQRPTAIVYANDPMAIAGVGVAQRAGLQVPTDLSVTGFDGSEIGAYLHPALTTVTTAVHEWGAAAADALLRLVDGQAVDDLDLEPARLVIRESSTPPGQDGTGAVIRKGTTHA